MLHHHQLVTSVPREDVAELQQMMVKARQELLDAYMMPETLIECSVAPTSHQLFQFATRSPDQRLWQ